MSMSQHEIREYMDSAKTARLATVNSMGKPHVVPVWFYYDGADVYIGTGSKSKKVRNIRENANVALVVDSGEGYPNVRGVLIEGKAHLVTEEEDLKHMLNSCISQFMTKYFGSPDHAIAKQFLVESQKKEKVIIRITTEGIQSWDYSR